MNNNDDKYAPVQFPKAILTGFEELQRKCNKNSNKKHLGKNETTLLFVRIVCVICVV